MKNGLRRLSIILGIALLTLSGATTISAGHGRTESHDTDYVGHTAITAPVAEENSAALRWKIGKGKWQTGSTAQVKPDDVLTIRIRYSLSSEVGANLDFADSGHVAAQHKMQVTIAFSQAPSPTLELHGDQPFTVSLQKNSACYIIREDGNRTLATSFDPSVFLVSSVPHQGMYKLRKDQDGAYEMELVFEIKK